VPPDLVFLLTKVVILYVLRYIRDRVMDCLIMTLATMQKKMFGQELSYLTSYMTEHMYVR